MRTQASTKRRGFTLIEVVISLGVFAFAIVVIVGSLATAGSSASEDARRAQAADLLHQCFGEMALAGTPGSLRSPALGLVPVEWGPSPVRIPLWFDANGNLVQSEKSAFFRCEITATRDGLVPLGHLYGRMVWPVRGETGNVELFTSVLLP